MYIANENDDDGCDFIPDSQCPNSARKSSDGDFTGTDPSSLTWDQDSKTVSVPVVIDPIQDMKIEGDEKIYLVLCEGMASSGGDHARQCGSNNSNLLKTASITIVGERVWADNTANTDTTTVALPAESQPIAASFTTGTDSNGYQVNNVKLKFGGDANDSDTSDDPADVSVRLFRDDGRAPGAPGAFISDLTRLDGTNTAPPAGSETIYTKAEGIVLEPNSKYWVRVSGTAGSLETTGNHGQTGWAIQDGFLIDTDVTAVGINWSSTTTRSLKMQVSGIPRGGVIVDTNQDTAGAQTALRVRENDSYTYSVRLDSPPPKETKVEVVSDNRSIATAVKDGTSTTTLTFTKETWWIPQDVKVHGGFVNDDIGTIIRHRASGDSFKNPANLPSVNVTVQNHVVDIPLLDNIGNPASTPFSPRLALPRIRLRSDSGSARTSTR